MAGPDRDWKTEAHNQGQSDGARGRYDNPYKDSIQALLGGGSFDPERADAYDEGYENGRENPSDD